jgi:antitoxin CcdA
MSIVYDESAPKKATNLSLNSDLLRKAKELNINLSVAFENTLIQLIKENQKEQWLQSNKESIEAYNKYVSKNGVFSKGIRSF